MLTLLLRVTTVVGEGVVSGAGAGAGIGTTGLMGSSSGGGGGGIGAAAVDLAVRAAGVGSS